ncbi:MAG: sulfatase [Elusimicrobia bacterium]|nr:sulfatase [Elusimicrobiota bacterium]
MKPNFPERKIMLVNRIIRKIIKYSLLLFGSALFLYLLFLAVLVIPNDRRIKNPHAALTPITAKRTIVYDLIDLSPAANLSHKDYEVRCKELKQRALANNFINDNADFHRLPENIHVSLGWYPLKVVHKNSLYAPAPTLITYELTIPKNDPQLVFSCGILDKPVEFRVRISAGAGLTKDVFAQRINPLPKYSYRYEDRKYRLFWQYFDVQMAERDYAWSEYAVDLSPLAGQKVQLQFITAGDRGQAFWGNPLITARDLGLEPKYNVLLVVLDSIGREAIGPQLDGRSYTPNLDRLAATGLSFEKHLANGNMTKQSVTSFLTSRLPFELGDVSLEYVASTESRAQFYRSKFTTLASALDDNGYLTGAIGVISLVTDGAGFGVDFGFNDARIIERYGYSNVHITNEAISWLQQNGDLPFALMVYYDSAHGPYKPPFRYLWSARSQFTDFDARSWYRTLYEASVAYNDEYLGQLLAALEKLGLKENTLVVVTSDHAENLDWHILPDTQQKVVFHDHGISLKDRDVQVPLIMQFPAKIANPLRVTETTEQLSLAPTILDLLNLPARVDFRGFSLAAAVAGDNSPQKESIFLRGRFNKGIRLENKYKYIRNFGVYEKRGKAMQDFIPEEVYDLQNDPLEQNNIITADFALRQRLRLLLDRYEPDPETNIFTGRNMGDKTLTLEITSNGTFTGQQINGRGTVLVKGKTLKLIATGDKTELQFSTRPYDAALRIKALYDGKKVPLSQLLVSSRALPLLSDQVKEIGSPDFYFIKGLPESEIAGSVFSLSWGRIAQFKQEWEKQVGVSGVFKEMLAEWGYLSEPKKK